MSNNLYAEIKLIIKKIILLCTLVLSFNVQAIFFITPKPPEILTASFVLMDYNSNKIIAASNEHAKVPPASLAKLMTSYVAFKRLEEGFIALDDLVNISEKAWKTGGSRSFVKVNTRVKLETLLKGMIIQSGNDASVALAEHIAGSEDTFVALMNQYASSMNMRNTNFENSSGLPDENQFTTSYDMAILAKNIIKKFPNYYKWFSEKYFTHNNIKQANRNNLLKIDKTIDGLKTGYTKKSGYSLVTSAQRSDMRLISVVLGSDSVKARERDSKALLDYGFRFFETQNITLNPQNIEIFKGAANNIKVGIKDPVYLTLERGKFKFINKKLIFKTLIAPINKYDRVGSVQVIFKQPESGKTKVIATIPLVALNSVKSGGIFGNIIDSIRLMF